MPKVWDELLYANILGLTAICQCFGIDYFMPIFKNKISDIKKNDFPLYIIPL